MVTADSFRTDFPEFADKDKYTDGQINFWLNISVALVPEDRWMDLTDMGVELATAHQLAIAQPNLVAAAGSEATPGQPQGLTTSSSVGPVSYTTDYSATTLEDGGFWNLTSYGIRFLQMARMFGAGPIQL